MEFKNVRQHTCTSGVETVISATISENIITKIEYEDKTNLYDGLNEMWKWAQKQPKRERFVWNEYELDKGIYSFGSLHVFPVPNANYNECA